MKPETIQDWKAWWIRNAAKSPAERTRRRSPILFPLTWGDRRLQITERARALSRYYETVIRQPKEYMKKSRDRFAINWQPYANASAWDMLTGPPQAKPVENIDLLMSLDSRRAFRIIYTPFASLYRGDPMPSKQSRMAGKSKVLLAFYSGVDFGDLDKAQCERRQPFSKTGRPGPGKRGGRRERAHSPEGALYPARGPPASWSP